ncbi:unnamed protein product [Phytophthora fragariaefolia]|uniref:Unnamed protein product n=1 Tax=Phytophthora fragariaefolia TaxID=1490495 RepID=A0A9W6Y088_9STRA|nr:unnamed protein product [Phytophthora fragariaefolia]
MADAQLPFLTGEARRLPGGGFYVQACPRDVHFCPPIPRVVAADADDSRDEEELPEAATAAGSSELLTAVETFDDDGRAAVSNPQPLTLHDAMDAMDSDDEELPGETSRRPKLVTSRVTQDWYLLADQKLSDTDLSSSEGDDEEELGVADEEESDDEPVDKRSAPSLLSWECDYLSVDRVDSIIRSNMTEIEARKPWRFVFRCLEVPFKFKRRDDPFDVFFMRWDDFWLAHGRAVWERAFWQPLIPGSTEYHRRKGRQFRAQRAFRELATDLLERLGDRFSLWLGKSLREGWWYRTEPFMLRRLFLRDRAIYGEYLADRVRLRWPRGKKFLLERGLQPIWWARDSVLYGTSDDA